MWDMHAHMEMAGRSTIPALRSKPQRGSTSCLLQVAPPPSANPPVPSALRILLRGFVLGLAGWAVSLFALAFAAGN